MRYRRLMPKMLQVRNIPDELHRALVRRADARGLTLTDFVQDILEREVSRPPREEVFERIRNAEPVDLKGRTGSDLIREARREAGRE